jgi:hypothetical protein
MSYSQHGEEERLLRHFGERTGRLLEIGAFDGRAFSNTLALIERGWEAVLVEPSARAFDRLMALHDGNPRVRLVNALIDAAPEESLVRFMQSPDCLSTTEPEHVAKWGPSGTKFQETFLPPLSVRHLLTWCEGLGFDFVSIDTEMTSTAIFHALMQHVRSLPEVICVEHDGNDIRHPSYAGIYYDGNNVILKRVR